MRLLFTGDYCPAGINFQDFHVDPNLVDLFKRADLAVGTLECPLTDRDCSAPYQPIVMKAPAERNQLFELFGAYSLANNHILDYGKEGAHDTVQYLEKECKGWFGYGHDAESALRPYEFTKAGIKVALFGVSQWYTARPNAPGACSDRDAGLLKCLKQYKAAGYFVVVMPHWNYEYIDYPSPASYVLSEKLCRAGADLVVGSHPHVAQGFHSFGDSSIYYSLGNFIFHESNLYKSCSHESRCHVSMIVSVDLAIASIPKVTLHFSEWSEKGIRLIQDLEYKNELSRIERLSLPLHSRRSLRKHFYQYSNVIMEKTSEVFSAMNKKQGLRATLRRLPRVRTQDVLIKLHDFVST